MISQYDIGTIVMLNSLKEEKEVYFTRFNTKRRFELLDISKGSSGIVHVEFFTYDPSDLEWEFLRFCILLLLKSSIFRILSEINIDVLMRRYILNPAFCISW